MNTIYRYFALWVFTFSSCGAMVSSAPFTRRYLATTAKTSGAPHNSLSRSALDIARGGHQDGVAEDEIRPAPLASKVAGFVPGLAAVGSFATNLGRVYTQQLDQRPILTKSYTAGLIFGLSDYIAQKIEQPSDAEESPKLDLTRLLASTLVGLLYFGPAAHYWYEMIFRLLPGTSLLSTMYKAFWGQVIFGPSFTCIFFATSLMQSGQFSLRSWFQKIRSDLPGAWLAGVGFWPLVDVISYSLIPVKWIPLFINMCSLVWTVYLSIVANRSK